jgi:hypothetical protein
LHGLGWSCSLGLFYVGRAGHCRGPAQAGLAAAGLGLLLAQIPSFPSWYRRAAGALAVAGLILSAQAVALEGYEAFTARCPELPGPLVSLIAGIARWLGFDAGVHGATVVIFSVREAYPVAATWSLFFDPVSICFIAGGISLLVVRCCNLGVSGGGGFAVRSILKLIGAVAVWLPLRVGVLLAFYGYRVLRAGHDDDLDFMDQFWSPWVHLAGLILPVAMLWRTPEPDPVVPDLTIPPPVPLGFRWIGGSLLTVVGVLALALSISWHPVGPRNPGRILFDDYHSSQPWPRKDYDTVRTDRPFDLEWYGRTSSYNYACIYDYCSHFYEMGRQTAPLTTNALEKVDVLVLKLPSLAFQPDEQRAIHQFVARGGGLLLIGDHTTVFGSGVILNEISRRYGFVYRYDCAFGVDTPYEEYFRPPLLAHPILGWVKEFDFATSCTLDPASSPGTAVVRGRGLKNLGSVYNTSNYYPLPRNHPKMLSGDLVQLWATQAGLGRVAAFTDSTIFSNFTVFDRGKSELMLGMLEWLNHRNASVQPKWLLLSVSLVLLLGGIFSLSNTPNWTWIAGACAAAGWWVAVAIHPILNRMALPQPPLVRPLVRFHVDELITKARLPKNGFISGAATEFGQVLRCILRLGYFYHRGTDLTEVPSNAVLLVNPVEESQTVFTEHCLELARYVENGGKLLILDSPDNSKSKANSVLVFCGMSVKPLITAASPTNVPRRLEGLGLTAPVRSAFEVSGGTPLLSINGHPVAAWKKYGQGMVCMVGCGSRFTDPQMGGFDDPIPQGEVKQAFDLFYAIARGVVEGNFPESYEQFFSFPSFDFLGTNAIPRAPN